MSDDASNLEYYTMNATTERNPRNGQFTSEATERRKAWAQTKAAIRPDRRQPQLFGMTFVQELGCLQRQVEKGAKA